MDAGWHGDPGDSLRAAVEEHVRFLTSEDFRETLRTAAKGRQPSWSGR
jgi:hypothetical protein